MPPAPRGVQWLSVSDSFEASPATIDEATLNQTAYDHSESERVVVTESDAAGTGRNVTVVSHVRLYTCNESVADRSRRLTAVGLLSTPSIVIDGEEQNTVGEESPKQLFDRFQTRLQNRTAVHVEELTPRDRQSVTVLGVETNATVYDAVTTVDGRTVEMTVEVARLEDRDDFVVVVAVYPSLSTDPRRFVSVMTLLQGISHPPS